MGLLNIYDAGMIILRNNEAKIKWHGMGVLGYIINCDSSKCNAFCCKNYIIPLKEKEIFENNHFLINDKAFLLKKQDKSCNYLEDNLCSIYENRPYNCKIYPFGIKKPLFENDAIYYPIFINNECKNNPMQVIESSNESMKLKAKELNELILSGINF